MSKYVAIIDYQLSNLFSVKHACESVGLDVKITSDPVDVLNADGVILPGVGAFGDAMKNLKKYKLDSAIKKFVDTNKPFMGVCLGMQLIFTESDEFGTHRGLNLIKGVVRRFPKIVNGNRLRIPQIGWNKIHSPIASRNSWNESYLKNVNDGEFMYFVHSFYISPDDDGVSLAKTKYSDFEYTSAVLKNNIFAVQFHPEKSSKKGLLIYDNFAKSIK